jgi:transglutaminase-like putative cysteine protease
MFPLLPLVCFSLASTSQPDAVADLAPRVAETRTYKIRQTVALQDVPASAKEVRLWVPIPADGAWQHVVDRRVVEAPAGWTLVHQSASGADMIVATAKGGAVVQVVVETTVVRESPVVDLAATSSADMQPPLFTAELATDAPLMSADAAMTAIASKACTGVSDPRQKVVRLLDAVADAADHYSKDPTKPQCGRGAAEDCMKNGGGCCTDLHSLFIAMARSQGIPARLQFGYRLKSEKEGTDYDPSYRCWVEYFLPGSGWVPTDNRRRGRGRAGGARGAVRPPRRAARVVVAGPGLRSRAQAGGCSDPDHAVRLGAGRRRSGRRAAGGRRHTLEAEALDPLHRGPAQGGGGEVALRYGSTANASPSDSPTLFGGANPASREMNWQKTRAPAPTP